MRDQLAEVEGHVLAGVAHTDLAVVPGALQRQVQASALPGVAEFVERHGDRAERGGRLALQEAEALGEFGRDQVAQADVVGQHDQPDAVQRLFGRSAHTHVAGDDRDFGLEVDAESLARDHNRIARAAEVVAAALVHQRVGVEAFGHFGIAGFSHQFDVVDVGGAVGPLVGAGQRRHALRRVERERMAGLAPVELVVEVFELWADEAPVVQRLLQAVGDAGGVMGECEIARNDDQLAVARSVFEGGEFHGGLIVALLN